MSGDSRLLETRFGRWVDLAACRGTVTSADEDIFFAPDLDQQGGNRRAATRMAATRESQALAVCARCPVQGRVSGIRGIHSPTARRLGWEDSAGAPAPSREHGSPQATSAG
jgi:hypothetical protein